MLSMNIKVEIPCPNYEDRRKKITSKVESLTNDKVNTVASLTERYSGRDIPCLMDTASMLAKFIKQHHLSLYL